MKKSKILKECKTVKEAFELINKLSDSFLRENKCKEKVDLFISVTCTPVQKSFNFKNNLTSDRYEIRCYFEDDSEEECIWMQNKIAQL